MSKKKYKTIVIVLLCLIGAFVLAAIIAAIVCKGWKFTSSITTALGVILLAALLLLVLMYKGIEEPIDPKE